MTVEIEAALGKETYGCFVEVSAPEFKRAISNLIDNAVDAIANSGKIMLCLVAEGGEVILTVSDNGKGVPQEILNRLGERGFTHGKAGGSGLGLYQARSTLERWRGRLSIHSSPGVGTSVEIRLPRAAPPPWFLAQIQLCPGQVVLVLDDDRAIHITWDQLLARYVDKGCEVLHFTEARLFREWLSQHRERQVLCLVDYELLRQEITGLDIIEQEEIADRAILVTSRFTDPTILHRAAALGLRMIPKGLVGQVPILMSMPVENAVPAVSLSRLRVLVIDDDEMIVWAWRKQQQRLGLAEVRTFSSVEACQSAALDYSKFDLAFVDLNIEGTTWAVQDTISYLKRQGVKRVFVATGAPGAELDGRCAQADGIATEKVPRDLEPYVGGAAALHPR